MLTTTAAAVARLIIGSIAVCPVALASVLVGLVAADDAAGARPEQSVMSGIMSSDPADYGAL